MQVWSARRKVGVYLAITFTVSWSIAIGFIAFGGVWGSAASQAVALLCLTPPAFAALIVKGAMLQEPVIDELGIKLSLNRWWIIAWLVPPVAFGLAVCIGGLMPGHAFDLSRDAFLEHFLPLMPEADRVTFSEEVRAAEYPPVFRMLLQGMVAGMTINAVRGLGEELGWRGLMYREVNGDFYRKALFIGVIWGVWYAPLVIQGYRYPGAPIAGVFMCIAWCILAGAIALEIREKSGSVFPAAILYGTIESMAKLPPLITGGDAITAGLFGLPGCLALAVILAFLRRRDFTRARALPA